MKKTIFLSIPLLVLMSVAAPAADVPTSPTSTHPALLPGQPAKSSKGTAKSTGHSTVGMGAEVPNNAEPLSGKVLETMNNGGYSYINLQKKSGDKVWVAVMETSVVVGSSMSFKPGIVMTNFESKGLKRTFDSIIFTDGTITAPEADTITDLKKKRVASGGSAGSTAVKEQKISVAKATGPNAITVEEAFTASAKLDKKKVIIRGKVVKVSSGIMKKNWVHIQDGTGSQTKKTNNLVCTSQELAEVGDVVTVSGTLIKDRDFGSGYRYTTIIENARFKK